MTIYRIIEPPDGGAGVEILVDGVCEHVHLWESREDAEAFCRARRRAFEANGGLGIALEVQEADGSPAVID